MPQWMQPASESGLSVELGREKLLHLRPTFRVKFRFHGHFLSSWSPSFSGFLFFCLESCLFCRVGHFTSSDFIRPLYLFALVILHALVSDPAGRRISGPNITANGYEERNGRSWLKGS